MKNGEILRGPPFIRLVCSPLNDVKATDAGTDVDTDAFAVCFGNFKTGVLHGFCACRHGEVDEAAHLAGLLLLHELVDVEVLHLRSKTHGVTFKTEEGDLTHTARPLHQVLPDDGCSIANATDQANAGNDNTARQNGANLSHDYFAFACASM